MKQSRLTSRDFRKISKGIEKFIVCYVSNSSAKGLVIGLSGGLDSSVVVKLAVNALGPSRVIGILMPSEVTPREDIEHAVELAQSLAIKYHVIDIRPLLEKFSELLPKDKVARGNLMARIRMNILYYFANHGGHIVAGTSDKSELQIGYFSKFGDGAADILPIGGLYKTQVKALAKFLRIPQKIVEKKSSPRLWVDHLAEEEIGLPYQTIDPILQLLVDRRLKPGDVAKKLEIPIEDIRKVKVLIEASRHKRQTPPIP